jgi:hypothetical protein
MGLWAALIPNGSMMNPHRSGGRECCYPITDSKEPGSQGQRQRVGILWIRQAGIPVIQKSSFIE